MAKKIPAAVQRVKFSSLQYNTRAGRYLSTSGKTKGQFIGPAAVRQVIDDDIEATAERMRKASAKLKGATEWYSAGGMTKEDYAKEVEAWRSSMARQIKALHLANTAAAKGGFHNLDSADYGRAGAAVREQYKALGDFAKEVAADPRLITGTAGRMDFEQRAGMYAEAGRGTYYRALHDERLDLGYKTMQNVLEPGAKHCHGDGSCIQMDEMGVVGVKDKKFKQPGFRTCGTQCKCDVEYFMADLPEYTETKAFQAWLFGEMKTTAGMFGITFEQYLRDHYFTGRGMAGDEIESGIAILMDKAAGLGVEVATNV